MALAELEGFKKWQPNEFERYEIMEFKKQVPEMGWAMAETIYMFNKLHPEKMAEYNAMTEEERLLKYPLREELKYKNGKTTIIKDAISLVDGEFKPDYNTLIKECGELTDGFTESITDE